MGLIYLHHKPNFKPDALFWKTDPRLQTNQTGTTESKATSEPLMGQVIKFVADFAIDDSSIEITLVHKRRALENESKEEKMQGKRLIIASTNCKKKLKSIEVIMIAQLVPQNGVDTVKQKILERQENENSELKAFEANEKHAGFLKASKKKKQDKQSFK